MQRLARSSHTAVLSVRDRFRGYDIKERGEQRKADVTEDRGMQDIFVRAWKDFRITGIYGLNPDYGFNYGFRFPPPGSSYDTPNAEHDYDKASRIISWLYTRYSAQDVGDFCLRLAEFQGEDGFYYKAGLFLSALMNEGKDDGYSIRTVHMEYPVMKLGMQNTKDIVVSVNLIGVAEKMSSGKMHIHGSVRTSICKGMRNGTVIIEGNCGSNSVDRSRIVQGIDWARISEGMEGGTVEIIGNIFGTVCSSMKGGIVIVNGDITGNDLGTKTAIGTIYGGEVHANGEIIGDIEPPKGGRIYHKGKLIAGG